MKSLKTVHSADRMKPKAKCCTVFGKKWVNLMPITTNSEIYSKEYNKTINSFYLKTSQKLQNF